MSSIDRFRDYVDPGLASDENTIITDYWLDFVAVRQENDEPAPAARTAADGLPDKMPDFEHWVRALLEDRKRMRVQFEIPVGPEPSLNNQTCDCEQKAVNAVRTAAGGRAAFCPGRNWSLADRFRNSFLFTTLQKLR
jgi:hypothetical protein